MRRVFSTTIAVVLLLSAISFAQSGSSVRGGAMPDATAPSGQADAAPQDEQSAKDLYVAYSAPHRQGAKRGRPGAKVRIELERGGNRGFVPVDTNFRAGDKVKFHFAVNFPAYVSIINLGSSGRLNLLFPYTASEEVAAVTRDYVVPRDPDLWFEFDIKPGVERLTFVFSAARIMPPNSGGGGHTMATGSGGGAVNPEGDSQLALADLNSRALSNGKDLNLVQASAEEGYVLANEQALRQPIGLQISLRHK